MIRTRYKMPSKKDKYWFNIVLQALQYVLQLIFKKGEKDE